MKKNLTLFEIILAVIIVAVVATISIPVYQGALERSKAKVCETNLKVLKAAIDIYGLENNVLPATLSQLDNTVLRRAWAQVLTTENPWIIKLAYYLVDWDTAGYAYAQEGFVQRYLSGKLKYITCPSDPTPPLANGVSYGLNSAIKGLALSEYRKLKASTGYMILVADCDTVSFSSPGELSSRHIYTHGVSKRSTYSNLILVNGNITKVKTAASSGSLSELSEYLKQAGISENAVVEQKPGQQGSQPPATPIPGPQQQSNGEPSTTGQTPGGNGSNSSSWGVMQGCQ